MISFFMGTSQRPGDLQKTLSEDGEGPQLALPQDVPKPLPVHVASTLGPCRLFRVTGMGSPEDEKCHLHQATKRV
jgi:hypothetical protein